MIKEDCQRCYNKLGFEWRIEKEESWSTEGYVWCRQLYTKIKIKDLDEQCFYNLPSKIEIEVKAVEKKPRKVRK